jgi:diaminopimelate decarboxylase
MEIVNNQYQIQGNNLTDLCKTYGTPLYVYNGAIIERQYSSLINAFQGVNLKIKYAAKALTNQAILKLLKKLGSGVDVVSINEVKLALLAGFDASDIMFTPNCVNFEEIIEAKELGVTINIDNLPYLKKFGVLYGNSYPICVRVNPHIDAGGNAKIMTGHKESKFGISIEQIEEVYAIVEQYNLQISGVHVHSGSDFKDAQAFVKATEIIFEVAKNFPNLSFLDFGSGFKVPYKEGDHFTNIEDLGKEMSLVFKNFCKEYGKELELWFEPGKYLVSESGNLLVNANLIKETPACTFVGVDSGLNHLIRPMMYDAYHDIFNATNPTGTKKKYHIVGYICETDTFGSDRELNEVRENDIIVLKNAGAYSFSMSSNYNSRFKPAEVLIYKNNVHLIRKRETFEDLLRNQIEIEL